MIEGAIEDEFSGKSVSLAGDFNGDGLSDIIIGAPGPGTLEGCSFVIYGKKGGYLTPIDLFALNASQGVIINNAPRSYAYSVSLAGDFNGDGLSDIIIGAYGASSDAGISYVVYGKKGGYPTPIDLARLNADHGVVISGAAEGDESGYSVSSAGDFNGDGLSDVIIGAFGANSYAGSSYVIYGKKDGYPTPIDLARLNANQGTTIYGAINDKSGYSVSLAGDFNGDGLGDVIVGVLGARSGTGSSYVVYGKKGGYSAPIDLKSLNATQGVIIRGAATNVYSGYPVALAGDFNGDDVSDIIIGAPYASPKDRHDAGSSYVVYGKKGGYQTSIDLKSLNATQGVIIQGATAHGHSGFSVSSAGDFNGDGLGDVIIGAWGVNSGAGKSYVIYGKKGGYQTSIDLKSLNATQGVIIRGAATNVYSGYSVALAGDFNGDNVSDVIIGAPYASPKDRTYAGNSYIIYGNYTPTNPTPYNGVNVGVAVVCILGVSVGLAVTYGDRIRNWIRSYTLLDEDVNSESHGEKVVELDKTDKDISSESRGEEVEAVELERTDENH